MINFFRRTRGSVTTFTALGLFFLIGAVALGLDVARLIVVKSELQKAADAAAMAGARGLWPVTLPVTLYPPNNPDCSAATSWARNTLQNNKVDNNLLSSNDYSIQVGRWEYTTNTFTQGCSLSSNAVQVTLSKGDLRLFFGQTLGLSSGTLQAQGLAVMDFARAVGKGTMPIVINKRYATPGTVIRINFNPDPLDEGGWFAAPPHRANAATFRDYIRNESCPPLHIGDIVNLQNGVDAAALHLLKDELDAHSGQWDTFLPTVDTDKFIQSEPIVGFVPFRISAVKDTGNPKYVEGTVMGLGQAPTGLPGGATNTGTLAPLKSIK
jgi:Flp pilus assembly protein TadG